MPGWKRLRGRYTQFTPPYATRWLNVPSFSLASRSAYPREIAGTYLQPMESYTSQIPDFDEVEEGDWPAFFVAARRFLGNEQMGYKMALCERDIGIYGFVLIGGLIFSACFVTG